MNSNIITIKQLKVIFISLLLLLVAFIAPFDETVLTINEELFVVISFFIFVDLFGNTIMNAIADMTDARIRAIVQRLSMLLLQKFVAFSELYAALVSITHLTLFRRKIMLKFRLTLKRIMKNRFIDLAYLLGHVNYAVYKATVNNYLSNYRLISNLAAENAGLHLTNVMAKSIAGVNNKKAPQAETKSNKRRNPKRRPSLVLKSAFKRFFANQFLKLQTVVAVRNRNQSQD